VDEANAVFEQLLSPPVANFHALSAAVDSAILDFLRNDRTGALRKIEVASPVVEMTGEPSRAAKAYCTYLRQLLNWWADPVRATAQTTDSAPLFVVGDSHSLSAHGLHVQHADQLRYMQTRLVKGCKQWHLGNAKANEFKRQFAHILNSLPESSTVLLTVGEIDCRQNEGLFPAWKKANDKPLQDMVNQTVDGFLSHVTNVAKSGRLQLIICGVPATNAVMRLAEAGDDAAYQEMIRQFNQTLQNQSRRHGLDFLDVFTMTDAGDGRSNQLWHIDNFHLRPDAMTEAFDKYLIAGTG
jgi:hypothetical protein